MTRQKPDDGLRAIMRDNLIPLGLDCQSIETGITGGGVPDFNWCMMGIEGWIECKWTAGWAVTLDPAQIGWIMRRVRHGGRVHIAVRRRHPGGPRLGPPVDELWVLPGALAVEARERGLRGLQGHPGVAGPWHGGPTRWDWRSVAACLVA